MSKKKYDLGISNSLIEIGNDSFDIDNTLIEVNEKGNNITITDGNDYVPSVFLDEDDDTPVILDPYLRSALEVPLGHPIRTLGDLSECWNKGIIQPLPNDVLRMLMDACANWDSDDDSDD